VTRVYSCEEDIGDDGFSLLHLHLYLIFLSLGVARVS
jgi:hypothetical protein